MIKKLNFAPFTEFWLSCTVNDLLSIVLSREPSYYSYLLVNSYNYLVSVKDFNLRSISIVGNQDFYTRLSSFSAYSNIELKGENLVEELKSLIDENKIIYVLIDSYYWLEDRVDFNLEHTEHYQMMTGYDTSKEIFYFFGDTFKGYGENEVSYKKLKDAIVLNSEQSTLLDIHVPEQLPKYELDIKDVIRFSVDILTQISEYSGMTYWEGNYNIAHSFYLITKIEERHKANIKLFMYLQKLGNLSESSSNQLIKTENNLYKNWNLTKMHFMKSFYGNIQPDFDTINNLIGSCLINESVMWNHFLLSVKT